MGCKKKNQNANHSKTRMSVSDAARMIGVCEQTVRNLANAGKIRWFWGCGTVRPSGVIAKSVCEFTNRMRRARGMNAGH